MRLDRLDLNLLIALDALLQERGVSLAANRLNLSQSATSGALARLRDYFRDDLLVLNGRSMALTPRAETLVDPVRAVLEQIRATIMVADPFEPATSDRTLSIMATDYIFEILLRPAIVAWASEAPGIRFELVPIVEHPVEALQRGQADLLIGIDNVVSTDHPTALLYTEDFVVAGWSGNPLLQEPMTLERFERLGHVAVRFGRQTTSYDGTVARLRSVARRVEVVAPNFTSVGGLLVGTNRIATVHRLLAARLAETLPLTLMELPFDVPPVREIAQWSSRSANDPAIAWLVGRLTRIAEQLRVSAGAAGGTLMTIANSDPTGNSVAVTQGTSPSKPAPAKRGKGRPVSGENDVGRERLLAAAETLLRTMAPARVTIARIAKEANADPALVRYYFGNRAALLAAVVDRVTAHAARAEPLQDGPVAALADNIARTVQLVRRAPFLHRLIVDELAQDDSGIGRGRVREMNLDLVDFYRRLLRADAGRDLVDADPLFMYVAILGASDFFSSAEPLIRELVPDDTDMEQLTTGFQAFMVRTVIDGLRKR